MDLVTVTCNRDFKQMLLQAKSVEQFLKPGTKHWVFINEQASSLYDIDWESNLLPYYQNHQLIVIYCDPKIWLLKYNGWVIQQIHKLTAVEFVKDDYLLLDSKNFFVVPTDLDTWTHEGSGILISKEINLEVWNSWDSINVAYGKELKLPLLKTYYAPETPFVVRKNVVKEAISRPDFIEWFVKWSDYADASEFIYYSYFLHKTGGDFTYNRRHHCLWPLHVNNLDNWFTQDDYQVMEISGIHQVWLSTASPTDKQKIVKWLSTFGLIDQNTRSIFE